ncbi:MAG: hypothetical protein IJT66_04045 [Clostridia bacterium]|nr:hypothetical protein [Clostridia bacterium]
MTAFERVEKVDTLLAGMPFAENHADFLTALYSRQYHPRALENRLKERFSLIRGFSDAHVVEKTKWRQLAAKIKKFRFIDRLQGCLG